MKLGGGLDEAIIFFKYNYLDILNAQEWLEKISLGKIL